MTTISNQNRRVANPFPYVDVIAACFCFVVVYSTITSFDRPTSWYHAAVSYELIFASSLLFLPFMFNPAWTITGLIVSWKPWLAVTLCMGLATLFSADFVVSVPRLRLIYSVILIGLMLKAWFSMSSQAVIPMVLLVIALVHAAILTLVLVSYQKASGNLGDYSTWLPYHSHLRHLGYHGTVAASCGVAFAVLVKRLRLVGLFLSGYALFGLIFFGSRGALLAWLVFAALALYFCVERRQFVFSAILTLAVAWIAASGLSSLKAERVETVAERSTSTASVGSRIELWREVLEGVRQRPVLGYGPEGYLSSHCCLIAHSQTHNSVLQVLIESGFLGLLAFLWLLKCTILEQARQFVRLRRSGEPLSEGKACVLSLLISLLGYSLVDGIFYHVIPLLLFAILCALLFADGRRAPQ